MDDGDAAVVLGAVEAGADDVAGAVVLGAADVAGAEVFGGADEVVAGLGELAQPTRINEIARITINVIKDSRFIFPSLFFIQYDS